MYVKRKINSEEYPILVDTTSNQTFVRTDVTSAKYVFVAEMEDPHPWVGLPDPK